MGPFGKYMVFEPNFMKCENQLLMWKVIYFSHYEPAAYFVSRLPPGLMIFQNYHFCFFSRTHHPYLPPFPMKPVSTLPMFSLATTHTSFRLVISFSLPFRSLFLILSKSPKERKREGKWRKGEVARWRKLWAIANDEADKVLIRGDNRQWRWWITRVGG